MKFPRSLLALLFAVATTTALAALPPGIAWHQGSVDAAFAKAKQTGKPVFLYWGAEWCPPCNRFKATIFSRGEFVTQSRQFIPVYVDGDSPKAQALATRFKVQGYPTTILFAADGREILRLPGESDAERYMQALMRSLPLNRPIKETLAVAQQRPSELSPDDWRLLGDYAWAADEAQLLPAAVLPATLQKLAAAVPNELADIAVRLQLQAALAATVQKAAFAPAPAADALVRVLAEPRLSRANFDLLIGNAVALTELLSEAESPQRHELIARWMTALPRLRDDTTLPLGDRLDALAAELAIANLDAPGGRIPGALLQTARERTAAAVKATPREPERHVVVTSAAGALRQAGLLDEAETLLKSELAHSPVPHYLMLELAVVAQRRGNGDSDAALTWYEKAYAAATGPATRLQWGVRYLKAITELAPDEDERFAAAAKNLMAEVAKLDDAFAGRNRRALEKLLTALAAWNQEGEHDAGIGIVRTSLGRQCDAMAPADPQREACEAVLNAGKAGP